MSDRTKRIIAIVCAALTVSYVSITVSINGNYSVFQAIAILLTIQGLVWLMLPKALKDFFDSNREEEYYPNIEWPDDMSDFLSLAGMIAGLFLAFIN